MCLGLFCIQVAGVSRIIHNIFRILYHAENSKHGYSNFIEKLIERSQSFSGPGSRPGFESGAAAVLTSLMQISIWKRRNPGNEV